MPRSSSRVRERCRASLATELGGRIEPGERVAGAPERRLVRVGMLGQLGGEPVELVLPALARAAVVRDGAVDVGAAPALVPARPRALRAEALERGVDVGDVARGLLDLLEQQRPQLVLDHAVQGEVLGAAVVEHPRDAARDVRVAQRLRRLR